MNEDDKSDELLIVYQMAKADGLSDEEAHAAVHKHAETNCGYTWKFPRPVVTTKNKV